MIVGQLAKFNSQPKEQKKQDIKMRVCLKKKYFVSNYPCLQTKPETLEREKMIGDYKN